jgi:hypothetical protein
MVELVDTQVSEACGRKVVEVQVLFRAPHAKRIPKLLGQSSPFGLRISHFGDSFCFRLM